jgi:hypothetical protein
MHTIESNWEDEENNRQVSFSVEFTKNTGACEIHKVTPKQVTFLCPESNSPLRSVGVWTDTGRKLLEKQLRDSGQMARIELEIDAELAV